LLQQQQNALGVWYLIATHHLVKNSQKRRTEIKWESRNREKLRMRLAKWEKRVTVPGFRRRLRAAWTWRRSSEELGFPSMENLGHFLNPEWEFYWAVGTKLQDEKILIIYCWTLSVVMNEVGEATFWNWKWLVFKSAL
jgi:hypothetical protein